MSKDSMKEVGAKTRAKVAKAVSSRKSGISAADIAKKTGCQPATVRLHLLALKKSGAVVPTRVGRSITYKAVPSAPAVA